MHHRIGFVVAVSAVAMVAGWAVAAGAAKRETLVSAKLASYDEKGNPAKVTVELTNKTSKSITRIQGGVLLKDAAGKTLDANGYTADLLAALEPGKSYMAPQTGWKPKPEAAKLLKHSPKKVTITFEASKINYADGSEDTF